MTDPILRLADIDKIFTGVHALSDVSMRIEPGEVHALLGENGAGKSTLIKVITGVYSLDGGNMWLDGKPFTPKSSSDAQAHGVSTVYQEVNLIPTMSVASNLFLERQPRRFGLINWKSVHDQSIDLLKRLKLDIDVEKPLGSYSIAVQQLVAIARALALKAKILILDEPTASLDSREAKILFDLMRELKSQGIAIIFVTHFLDQVYEVSDRITVLRNGMHVATHLTKELTQLDLVSLMLGKAFDKSAGMQKHTQAHHDIPYLDVEGIGKKRVLDPISLKVHTGEVLGLAGLLGSGRSETVNLIFGAIRSDQGKIKINGHSCHIHSPRQAIRQGLGFCPEDRRHDGLVGELSVRENIILALQAKRGWLKPVSEAQQHKIADDMIKQLGIVTPDAEKPAGQLSGGNQQKVILARWLAANPNLLILDEPTRGIDIGAHAEIVALIRRLCEEQGMALLVVSSELDEVVSISDRILVLRERHQAAELEGEQVNQQRIIEAIAS
ncbi:sugar ABC transporter ATP-binding protein [Celerinatantimonas diazotrophica]|uniref:Monosaccharide ABC transporter ATP-binding protein (CUT2 family) n=1 Tax=Celerinatantimonas diazotrophica TaxID=412034 RepID=A0A4R1JA14_9GAMM|nr:sugar ABC transporter ATP-binding protein [Celerinatantimonas diazotrophica]TCK47475.1 monosaccharide ABC transporter ATP-binding protein (CUT2 family) [Celerinatantimonas diazotrophica]CAG9296907.1 Fructose import ATP-binding protein FruK [Celerinatantimonas diazotrophica]